VFEPIVAGNIEGEPAPDEYIVDGMIPRPGLTLLAGEKSIGKTFLSEHLQVSTALGRPWVGRETQECDSFAVYGEDKNNHLHGRLDRICAYERVERAELGKRVRWIDKTYGDPRFLIYKFTSRFSDKGEPTPFWRALKKQVKSCGLLILDNAGLVFSGWASEQVTLFLLWLDAEADEMNLSIMLLHHPNKAGDSPVSGVGDWLNRPRQVYSFEMPPTPDGKPRGRWNPTPERILGAVKASYIPSTDELWRGIPLKWEGGVLKTQSEPTDWGLDEGERRELDLKVLNLIGLAAQERDPFFRRASSPKSFPSRASKRADGWASYGWRELDMAVARLVNLGQAVEVTTDGKTPILRRPGQTIPGERPIT
jgi:RecA-family ATPase